MKFIAKTLYGLEPVLEKELAGLGASDIVRANRAVTFSGDKSLLYRANYCCRTAMSVLATVSEFRIWSKDDLYSRGKRIVAKARNNAGLAGLNDLISFEVSDFCDVRKAEDKVLLVMNPPYGERIRPDEILSLYGMIGSTLKRYFTGSAAMIISSHREALKQVGLKHAGKHILFNGALECLLLRYEMYEGSRKMKNN
jgi:23S rRNA G2445 N2-methylase RlmL